MTKILQVIRTAASKLRHEDRGDFIVTPAVMILVAGSVLLVGGLVYAGTRSVAPGVNNSRQGITLDDDGNIVQGGVGVIPVPTPEPTEEPEPEPTPAPRRVIREEVTVIEETQPPVYVPVPTYNPHPDPTPHVEEYDDPCVDEPGNDIEPEDGMCPGHGDGGGTGGGGHGGTS